MNGPSHRRLPGSAFLPVYRRNLLVWRKLAAAGRLGKVAGPVSTVVAFGYGVGSLLPRVDGMSYIGFLADG